MLRLFVNIKDHYVKVREIFPHDDFSGLLKWRDQIEFKYTEESNFTMSWTSLLPDLGPTNARALVEFVGARYPVSPHYNELKAICPEMAFQGGGDEWVFYGGTFNPWHQGHQACLNLLPKHKTCFVLPDLNPHKEMRNYELVSAVLDLSARARFGDDQYLVPTFLIGNVQNPTVSWIERLKKEFPQQKLSLLLGHDSFGKINTWTKSSDLLSMLHCIYVVSRMESEAAAEESRARALTIAPGLKIQFLGRHGFEELSSTELRRRL